ncbi:hypothetical protein BJY01DRAFT_241939 [Aspergillus pseudoustus]|uniref:Cupin type-2 domain-containing protein n=1 Tax=Aspergillus pseudoustus TaxID=1810923 RepID=A0ABR4L233_9EURO
MASPQTSSTQPLTEHGLRNNTRYITGINPQGRAVVLASPNLRYHDRGGYAITRLYQHEKIPTNINDQEDLKRYLAGEGHDQPDGDTPEVPFQLVHPLGANFVQGDMGPSSSSVWHRTISVDFVTVVEGELILLLGKSDEDCTKVHLKQGDSVIQRGTLHKWVNPSNEKPARWVATLVGSVPFKVGTQIAAPVWIDKV